MRLLRRVKIILVRSTFHKHGFHLVDISPWPIVCSFALLSITISSVCYFNDVEGSGYGVALGFISVVGVISLWFRDVSAEGGARGLSYVWCTTFSKYRGSAIYCKWDLFFCIYFLSLLSFSSKSYGRTRVSMASTGGRTAECIWDSTSKYDSASNISKLTDLCTSCSN